MDRRGGAGRDDAEVLGLGGGDNAGGGGKGAGELHCRFGVQVVMGVVSRRVLLI